MKYTHVRHGMGAVRPYIHGPLGLLDFVKEVFGAEELERHEFGPESFHVELRIGDAVLVIEAGELPPEVSPWTCSVYVYVEDVDAAFARAVELGAKPVAEVQDKPYEERQGGFTDVAGNSWWVGKLQESAPGRARTVSRQCPPALLLIDVQQGLDEPGWGARNNPHAEARIIALLSAWRKAQWPVIHVQHMSRDPDSPLHPELPGNSIKPEARPEEGEPVFRKDVNSAFIGTSLEGYLHEHRIHELVIAGLTTDHCVSTTARMAGNLGFKVTVVEDATATFERTGPGGAHYSAEQMHGTALASLDGEFAQVRSSSDILARCRSGAAA